MARVLAKSRGKLILIKHVLHSILAFSIAALDPPATVIKTMERMFANFFWGQLVGKAKSHWISWRDYCKLVKEGGIGIQAVKYLIRAYSYSLWWKFRKGGSLWADYMRARYCASCHPLEATHSSSSPLWKRMM